MNPGLPDHWQTLYPLDYCHLMDMDDIKLSAKNEKELETLIQTLRLYSQDIGIEFGIDRRMCQASNEKRQTTPNGYNGTIKSRKD